MPWKTTFVCEDVKFSIDEHPGCPYDAYGCDNWTSVKLSVHELGVETPWLLVEKLGNRSLTPIVFRAMKEGWKISCDEQTMTITMHGDEVETLMAGNQKLRFDKVADFWWLVYQISISRLHDYHSESSMEERANISQEDMEY